MVSVSRTNPSFAIAIATIAYFVAVTQRSSLGAVSDQAIERFSVLAFELSTLAIMQLLAYAAMQIPAGLLIDRFGIRMAVTFGLLLMGGGQVQVALAEQYWQASAGRLFLGIGDAFIFISLVRLIQATLDGRRGAKWQQFLTNIGQLGQVASAIPFAWLVGVSGWTSAFLSLATIAFATASLTMAFLDQGKPVTEPPLTSNLKQSLRETFSDPAARTAFWTHFTLQSSGSTFVLLWGRTFIEHVYGASDLQAGIVLSSFVLFAFISGPVIARVSTHSFLWRRRVVSAIAIWIVAAWILNETLAGVIGIYSMWFVMPAIAAGGAGSMIAFQITQAYCPPSRLGLSNGFANVGGFLATLLMIALVGLMVDLLFALGVSEDRFGASSLQAGIAVHLIIVLFGFWRFRKNHAQLSV